MTYTEEKKIKWGLPQFLKKQERRNKNRGKDGYFKKKHKVRSQIIYR